MLYLTHSLTCPRPSKFADFPINLRPGLERLRLESTFNIDPFPFQMVAAAVSVTKDTSLKDESGRDKEECSFSQCDH